MNLRELLSNNRETILKGWLKFILETYPPDTQRFLKKQKDQFANPVRSIFEKEIQNVFDWLISDKGQEELKPSLDGIVRVRAIQDFEPSKALSFIFKLKDIIKETIQKQDSSNRLIKEADQLYGRVDEILLCAFDIYMTCREKIYKLRADEAVNQVSGLLRKKGLLCEIPQWGEAQSNNTT